MCLNSVGENEEVSIKEVTDAIVKAVGFQGKYSVLSP
jgi:GDP-L-fucose synthase